MKNLLSKISKLALIVVLSSTMSLEAAPKTSKPCLKYDKKIDKIKDKMRQGYTVAKGNYYKHILTQLQNHRVLCEQTSKLKKKRKLRETDRRY